MQIDRRTFDSMLAAHYEANQAMIRRLLGAWVSELEPVVVYDSRSLRVLGLTAAGQMLGSYPPVFNPFN